MSSAQESPARSSLPRRSQPPCLQQVRISVASELAAGLLGQTVNEVALSASRVRISNLVRGSSRVTPEADTADAATDVTRTASGHKRLVTFHAPDASESDSESESESEPEAERAAISRRRKRLTTMQKLDVHGEAEKAVAHCQAARPHARRVLASLSLPAAA